MTMKKLYPNCLVNIYFDEDHLFVVEAPMDKCRAELRAMPRPAFGGRQGIPQQHPL